MGTGLSLLCYPAGITLTGIDLSPAMLAIARDRAKALGMTVSLREASAVRCRSPAPASTPWSASSRCATPRRQGRGRRDVPGAAACGRLVLLDHVASDRRWVVAIEQLLEPLSLRMHGDYLTRRPLPLVKAAGFAVTAS